MIWRNSSGPRRLVRWPVSVIFKALWRGKMGGKRGRKRGVIIAILSLILTYYLYQTLTMPVRFFFVNRNTNSQCILPDLDPWDKSIMKYVWSPDPIHCDPIPNLVFVNDGGYVGFNISARKSYDSEITCAYRILSRTPGDDYSVNFGEEVRFDPPFKVPSDFFRVICRNSKKTVVYDNLHESVYSDGVERHTGIGPDGDDHYSVFMFGIDSTSRLSAIRKLPKTYEYLTKHLGAHVFKGYMKVGDNTFPNLIPVLTGKRAWTSDLPNIDYTTESLDSFPFIWRNFSAAKYATMFGEDYPDIATFNTGARGFSAPPTHHYMRPWMLGMKKTEFLQTVLNSVLLNFEYKSLNFKKTSSLCFGTKPVHQHVISYYKRFSTMYKDRRRFGLTWLSQICHEFVNFLELGDTDFYEFFKFLNDEGHLENSFLIFFSDHGSRIDDIRNTFVGRVEERMPLLSIVTPKSFKAKYPEINDILKDNTNMLTSNFDLHETLTDILNSNFASGLGFQNHHQPRGISLFRHIPEDRSCADASIPENYCACYDSNPIKPTDSIVTKVAEFSVSHLNQILRKYDDICAQLHLYKIHEAQVISLGLSSEGEEENRWTIYRFFSTPEKEKQKRFLVVFETTPGHARFEATVSYNIDGSMAVLGDVSRTNKYGDTSVCVPEKKLRLYCYCKTLL